MKLSPVRADVYECPQADAVRLKGLIGERIDATRLQRLLQQEEDQRLQPFQQRGTATRGDWHGEFMGTWVATACTVARYADDSDLRAKVDRMVKAWIACQDEDGYLGTYKEEYRWQSWDVWVQAHDLIGLLSYYFDTASEAALNAAIWVAQRVMRDFGPGKRYIHQTGLHGGMASSAILEPMVWLHWVTGDHRYLDFARWLVEEDWEAPGGPAITTTLLAGRGVAGTANGKAAEMLIDYTGMAELYRATGDERYLKPILIAWEDIVQHHLYVTGSASTGEHFWPEYVLRNDGVFRLGETCVTMTWLYLNLSLGRLTGEARFFDMVEQALYNHLLGAQSPDGRGWAYYQGLRDSKRYRWHTEPDCCPTRGERALAQMPRHIFATADDGLVVNFYEPAEASLTLRSGRAVSVRVEGEYPFDGAVRLSLEPEQPTSFALRLRLPGWCAEWSLTLNGAPQECATDEKGYLLVERVWAPGDCLEFRMEMPVRVLVDALGNVGRVALMRGPLVYAADSSYLPKGRLLDDAILWLDPASPSACVQVRTGASGRPHLLVPTAVLQPQVGAGAWRVRERYYDLAACKGAHPGELLELVPFFEAGNRDPEAYQHVTGLQREAVTSITYQVWLPFVCNSRA